MSWLPTVAHLAGKHLQVFFEPGSWPTMLSHFSRSEVNSGSADGVVKALETHRLAHRLQLHRMADGIEQKLNMSLDDLANQKRQEDLQIHRRSGSQRRHGRSNGLNRAGGYGHQQRPMPGPAHGAPDRAYVGQRLDALMWPAVPMRPQHGWQSGGRGHCGTQRPSVFSRLTELPQQTYHQLPQQFEPVPQQQYVQYADKQPPMSGQPQQLQRSMQPRASPQPNLAAINLQCRLDQATGLVIIQHSGTDIVKAGSGGDVILDSGGDHSLERLAAINAALSHINICVKEVGNAWSISDGKGLIRFEDGVKLPAKGPLTAGRAMVLLHALTAGHSKAAATTAQQASMQAAIAAGLVPRAAAAAGPDGAALDKGPESAAIRRLTAQGRYAPY